MFTKLGSLTLKMRYNTYVFVNQVIKFDFESLRIISIGYDQ